MSRTTSKQGKMPDLSRHSGWLLGLGIVFIVLGMIGVSTTFALTLMSVFVLGILFVIGGIAQIIDAFKSQQWKAVVWHVIIALFYLIAGSLVIYDPILASVFITMILAWIFILIGITRFMMALTLRHTTGWGWFLVSGFVSVILGVLILLQWPFSGLWVIGLFIAIELIIAGWTYIFLAIAMRQKI